VRIESAPGAISKGVLMKELCEAIIGGALLGVLVMAPALLAIWEEAHRSSPNSCRQLDSVERKCAYGSCDRRMIERLTKECLRASGQWGEQP
jgi:hypothetical protein